MSFNKQAFFDFKHKFIISVCQNGKLLKRQSIIAISKWSRIALAFDGLVFFNVKGDISICSPDLTFSVCPSHRNW